MEAANAIATVAVVTNNDATNTVLCKELNGRKKKTRSTSLFKAALFTLFGKRKATKIIQAEVVADANNWTMLVGCMRPLNLQDKESTLMLANALDNEEIKKSENMINAEEEVLVKNNENMVVVVKHEDDQEEVTMKHPSSDAALPSSPSSECGGDSRYASALNLQELDKSGSSDDEEDNEQYDDTQGDAMIDMKAEMFIAQFYAQMRIQNITSSS